MDLARRLLARGLEARTGPARAELASEVFTYLHLPIIGGVILCALGVEQAMAHLEQGRIGWVGAVALGVGLATSLLASVVAVWRATGEVLVARAAAAVVVGLLAFTGAWPPVLVLASAAGVLWVLALVEWRSREAASALDG